MNTKTIRAILPFLILLAAFAYNLEAEITNSFPNGAIVRDGTNSNIKYLNYNTTEPLPTYSEGRIFYDSGTAALSYYPAIQGSIMQIGQELWIYGYNAGVATITNGMAVRATGSLFGVLPIMTPSKADASSTARVDAICTGDVSPSSAGLFTVTGMLNDVDTSAFTVGDELFLSAATAGELTNVEPASPSMVVKCAVVLKKHATDGKMQACIHIRGALGRAQFADGLDTIGSISEGGTSLTAKYLLLSTHTANITATKELTGFESPESVSMSYDTTERKVTLTQTDGVIVWWRGTRHNLGSPWVSAAHDDAQGAWYLSASGTGALDIKWTDELWNFYDVQVAQVKKGANDTIAIKDTHGLMQWQTHLAEHFSVGTYRYSGGFLTDGTYAAASSTISDANNTPGFDSAVIYDEDSPTTIPVWTEGTYTRLSFTGTGTVAFETAGTSIASIGSTYPFFYNYSGGTFTRTETVTGRFLNYYQLIIPVGSDVNSQLYRMVILQPQSAYTSLAAAQAEDFRQLQLGSLTFFAPELVAFARITVQTSASYGSAGKFRIESVSYLAGSKASQVTIANLTVPNNADTVQASVTDFDSILTAADNTVQKALDTLDNNAIGTTTFADHAASNATHGCTIIASEARLTDAIATHAALSATHNCTVIASATYVEDKTIEARIYTDTLATASALALTNHNATSTAHNATMLASEAYVTGYAAKLAGDAAQAFSASTMSLATSTVEDVLNVNGAIRTRGASSAGWSAALCGVLDYNANIVRLAAGAPAGGNNDIWLVTHAAGVAKVPLSTSGDQVIIGSNVDTGDENLQVHGNASFSGNIRAAGTIQGAHVASDTTAGISTVVYLATQTMTFKDGLLVSVTNP